MFLAEYIPTAILISMGSMPLLLYIAGFAGENGWFARPIRAVPGFLKPVVFTTKNYLFERTIFLHLNDGTILILPQSEFFRRTYAFPHRLAGVFSLHFLKYAHFWNPVIVRNTLRLLLCENAEALVQLPPQQRVLGVSASIEDPSGAMPTKNFHAECAE